MRGQSTGTGRNKRLGSALCFLDRWGLGSVSVHVAALAILHPFRVSESGHSDLVVAGNNYHLVGGSAQVPAEDASGSSLDPLLAAGGSGPTLGDAWALESLSAYTLLDGSPMIDLGLALSSFTIDPGSRDFFGNPLLQGQGPDVGSHERR